MNLQIDLVGDPLITRPIQTGREISIETCLHRQFRCNDNAVHQLGQQFSFDLDSDPEGRSGTIAYNPGIQLQLSQTPKSTMTTPIEFARLMAQGSQHTKAHCQTSENSLWP